MSYAGDISPTDAYRMISEDDEALMIDVRTMPEWAFVGLPDLSAVGKQVMRLSWQQFPTMEVNAEFTDKLAEAAPDIVIPLPLRRPLRPCRDGNDRAGL